MRITSPPESARAQLPEVDLADPHLFSDGDPHLVWQTLRAEEPVYWQDVAGKPGFWSVTKYDDCCHVLGDYEAFTSSRGAILKMLGVPDPAGGRQMAVSDPPRHTELRRPLQQLLTKSAIESYAHRLQAAIRTLIAPVSAMQPWDLGAAMTALPMIVSGALMGLPTEDYEHLVRWGMMTVAPDDDEVQVDGDPAATLQHAHRNLFAYFSDEIQRRRRLTTAGSEDLVDRLMAMRVNGSPLSDGDVVSNCYSLLLGANVNTGHVISAAVMEFFDHPEQYTLWATEPKRMNSGIREALRWSSPVVHFLRYAIRDIEIRGRRIRKGEGVVAWIPSANRDDEVFDAPFRFDVARRANREISFGYGPHRCIGAAAALITIEITLKELFARVARFEPAGPVEHLCSNFTAGIKHLPVVAHPWPDRRGS